MTLQEVLDAKANDLKVFYNGQAVTITKASPQMIYVSAGPGSGPIRVTPDQLSPLE